MARHVAMMPSSTHARWAPSVLPANSMLSRSFAKFWNSRSVGELSMGACGSSMNLVSASYPLGAPRPEEDSRTGRHLAALWPPGGLRVFRRDDDLAQRTGRRHSQRAERQRELRLVEQGPRFTPEHRSKLEHPILRPYRQHAEQIP